MEASLSSGCMEKLRHLLSHRRPAWKQGCCFDNFSKARLSECRMQNRYVQLGGVVMNYVFEMKIEIGE